MLRTKAEKGMTRAVNFWGNLRQIYAALTNTGAVEKELILDSRERDLQNCNTVPCRVRRVKKEC